MQILFDALEMPRLERVAGFLGKLNRSFDHGLQGSRVGEWLCECFLNSFL